MSENTPDQSTAPLTETASHGDSGGDQPHGTSSAVKPPSQWATGDEPATGPQQSYVHTLAHDAGEEVPDDLTKAQASQLIDELQDKSPRVD